MAKDMKTILLNAYVKTSFFDEHMYSS